MMRYAYKAFAILGLAISVFAQQAQQGPKPKSQKEVEALQKIQQATDPQTRMKAIDNVLENFADTEYKHILLDMAIQSAQQARDPAKVEFYADRALKEDPKDVTAQLAVASSTIQGTKEFDLDKDQKLAKAEKNANGALESLKTATPPNSQVTDAQWQEMKKQMSAEAYATLGAVALFRKKPDDAVASLKSAAEADPEPVVLVRLAHAYNEAKQPDNALATCDKILAMSDATPQVKQIAQQEKARAEKAKAATPAPATSTPAPGTTPQPAPK
jgi:tetratricopeptide (TPR) repeat protein